MTMSFRLEKKIKKSILSYMEENIKKKDKEIQIRNNQILSNYIKELNSDVKLNEFNLREKSLLCSSIWAKWISYLFLEKENLQRILDAKQKILKKKTASSKSQDSILKMKSEEKISENDETIKKLNALFKNTQDNIDYIERALNILNSFGFNIKNAIDSLKLQMSH